MRGLIGVYGLLLAVRLWHFVVPLAWIWLNPEQLRVIDAVLLCASFGAVIALVLSFVWGSFDKSHPF
jgi:hypothetical protein